MNIQAFNSTPTMSSIEMVEFINSQRKEGEAELRHDNFMAKVPKVLGEEDALILKGIYKDAYGRDKPCYRLPKREACLNGRGYVETIAEMTCGAFSANELTAHIRRAGEAW